MSYKWGQRIPVVRDHQPNAMSWDEYHPESSAVSLTGLYLSFVTCGNIPLPSGTLQKSNLNRNCRRDH